MEKSKISINITQEDIDNALLGIIDLNIKNRKDITKLLSAVIYDNTQCAEWFIKMSVGARYPTMPKVGDIGFINLSEHFKSIFFILSSLTILSLYLSLHVFNLGL